MESFENFLSYIVGLLWGNWLMVLFLFLGVYCSINTRFIQIRKFGYIFKEFFLGFKNSENKNNENSENNTDDIKKEEVKEVQGALFAIASCVGSGNIVGVSTAVILGGPGALFWMWFAAFLGMATKFTEIALGIMYREKNENSENGEYIGGPMYYISKGLNAPFLGTSVAVFLFIQNTSGTFIQSNTISNIISRSTGINIYIVGVMVAVVITYIISGGFSRLVKTVEKLVPIMALIYIISGLFIILINYQNLPEVFESIFTEAFSFKAGSGATMGLAMRYGIARGIYSNEAGEGSAAVTHSTVTKTTPTKQGLYGIVEVFIDTIIICSITGLVILTSDISLVDAHSTTIVSDVYGSVFKPLRHIVNISLILFCFTSMLSQWYFGYVSLNFLKFNDKKLKIYQVLFPIAIVIGSIFTSEIVWLIQDLALVLLILPNIVALIILAPKVRNDLKDFESNQNL